MIIFSYVELWGHLALCVSFMAVNLIMVLLICWPFFEVVNSYIVEKIPPS